MIHTLEWMPEGVVFIDQTKLPTEEVYVTCRTYQEVADAIKTMIVRGAPAIGATGSVGGQFMQHVAKNTKISVFMPALGGLTVLSGIGLFWNDQAASSGTFAGWRRFRSCG